MFRNHYTTIAAWIIVYISLWLSRDNLVSSKFSKNNCHTGFVSRIIETMIFPFQWYFLELLHLIIRKILNLSATTPIKYSQGRLLQNDVKQKPTQDAATDDGCCTLHFCFRYCQYPRL